MTSIYLAAQNKYPSFKPFAVTDEWGNSYLYVRSVTGKGFFNIAKCEVNIDGMVPDAALFSNEEVAYLLGLSEDYQDHLARVETSLREWIDFREAWSRKGKRKTPIQKQEVSK